MIVMFHQGFKIATCDRNIGLPAGRYYMPYLDGLDPHSIRNKNGLET
jgi:hypothetical protein